MGGGLESANFPHGGCAFGASFRFRDEQEARRKKAKEEAEKKLASPCCASLRLIPVAAAFSFAICQHDNGIKSYGVRVVVCMVSLLLSGQFQLDELHINHPDNPNYAANIAKGKTHSGVHSAVLLFFA